MISRPLPAARRYYFLLAIFLAPWAPLSATAGELMPFEIPEEEIRWDEIELNEFNIPDPGEKEPEPAKPVDLGPELPPPAIDAYLDTSFSSAGITALGYDEEPGGYRFIAGFRLDNPALGNWSVAAEFGYNRIGRAERSEVTIDDLNPAYTLTRTDTYRVDLSSLDFGTRVGYRTGTRLEWFGRAGMQFYHVSSKEQTQLAFTPKNFQTPPPDQQLQPASTSTAKANVYGTLGVALMLGKVPSLYAEHGSRIIDNENVQITNVGVLLNF